MFLLTLYAALVVFGNCAPSLPGIAGNLAEYVIPASKGQVQEVQTQSQANTLRIIQLQATVDALVAQVNSLTPVRVRIYSCDSGDITQQSIHTSAASTALVSRRPDTHILAQGFNGTNGLPGVNGTNGTPGDRALSLSRALQPHKFGLCVPYRGCALVSDMHSQGWRGSLPCVCTAPCMHGSLGGLRPRMDDWHD